MQKQGNGKSVVQIKQAWICCCANVVMQILLILYTSPHHIYKTILIAKNKEIGVNLTEYTWAKRTWQNVWISRKKTNE